MKIVNKSSLPQALEEKNQADFITVTNRISDALQKISSNPKLKPTQSVLARLSKVSRGTLNNRVWPLEKLEEIKSQRKDLVKLVESEKESTIPPLPSLSLEERLNCSREEVRVWKTKADQYAKDNEHLRHLLEVQTRRVNLLQTNLENSNDPLLKNVIEFNTIKPI